MVAWACMLQFLGSRALSWNTGSQGNLQIQQASGQLNQGCHLPASEHCSSQVVKRERFTVFLQKASLASVLLVTGKAGIIDCCKKCGFQNNKYNTVNLYSLQNSFLMGAALPAWPEHQLFSNSIKDTQSLPWPSWFLASLTSPERGREENGTVSSGTAC